MSNGQKEPTFWEPSLSPSLGIWCDWTPQTFSIYTHLETDSWLCSQALATPGLAYSLVFWL